MQKSFRSLFLKAFPPYIANARQFGNNAYINPTGCEDDGRLELIVVHSFPKSSFPAMASRLFLQSIHRSKYVDTHRVIRASIINHHSEPLQIDGEFEGTPERIDIEINPSSLNILVPE